MWHVYTMEYYSAIKRNEIELFVVRWMELESVIQSEVSQKEKNRFFKMVKMVNFMLCRFYIFLKRKLIHIPSPKAWS